MSDKIIYTALFGPYEELKEPLIITLGWRYVCVSDQPAISNAWNIVPISEHYTGQMAARYAKIFCYNKHSHTQIIWIDASFQINCDLNEFWNKNYKGGITAPKHPVRKCVYKEADVCTNRGLDGERVRAQVNRYYGEGLPVNHGLVSSGILLRDNSEPVQKFCDLWWKQIEIESIRDQIGFSYTDWKMPGVAHTFDYDYRTGTDFIYKKHFHKR